MATFFGERWDAPIVDDATPAPTPIGQSCYDCGEPIADGDRGFLRPGIRKADRGDGFTSKVMAVHAECDLRSILGHEVGICRCTGYDASRATAKLVWQRVNERRGRPLEDRR